MRPTWRAEDGAWETALRGWGVFAEPRINKGTAFSPSERAALGLIGLMPGRVFTLDEQAARSYAQYQEQPSDLLKNVFLTALHDRNEVLFFRLLADHLREMLAIVYTPTVGEAIERYSHEYRRPRGVFLSVDAPELIETSFRALDLGPDDVDLIVATDGEAILGIGDWGIGGIAISIGKLVVYTAAAGIDPHRVVPVILDVGTNRPALLEDPLYLGNRHARVATDVYDGFVEEYVRVATSLFPHALLHWEDFGTANAHRVLDRYRDRILTFNDDIQGTGAVNLAAVLSGVRISGVPLPEQRVVIFGAGSAGIGNADQFRDALGAIGLSAEEAASRIWCVDRHGLLVEGAAGLLDFQTPYARPAAEVAGWEVDPSLGGIGLPEVVRRVRPTILIGTSTQHGAFTEDVIRTMAGGVERPIILPLSNPTRLAEAVPADLVAWTDGRALIATGSPFPPVTYNKVAYVIGQANNALVFPGLGLGGIVARATKITNAMLLAAAHAVAEQVDATALGAPLLPLVDNLRATSLAVATAVARAAAADGVATSDLGDDLEGRVARAMWSPEYRAVRAGAAPGR